MSSKFLPVLAGVTVMACATSAFAFEAQVTKPTPLRTHAYRGAAIIEVIPANTVIDMAKCVRGWCEAVYADKIGYVHTPVLLSTEPIPAYVGPEDVILVPFTAIGVVTAPVVSAH